MPSLSVSYNISPPPAFSASTATPEPSSTLSYPLDASTPLAHLESLERALQSARDDLNARLTEWKDALKDVEKPAKKGKKKSAEEDEDEGDEEEEE
ncbi:uncharacterized protein JCM10292_002967 [Rhodotorula paludigena]|uniref:uncharacterized protein n=1 Tax=Rhodotorula paludigena TaxID=86838 RepID=UPI00317CFE64